MKRFWSRKRIKPSAYLTKMYRQFNRAYFGNRLPKDTFIFWHYRLFEQGSLGECNHPNKGEVALFDVVKRRKFGPYIPIPMPNISIAREVWRMGSRTVGTILLHEMMHLAGTRQHGPSFDRERIRLMKIKAVREMVL